MSRPTSRGKAMKTTTTLRTTADEKAQIYEAAKQEGMSTSCYIRRALAAYGCIDLYLG